MMYSRSVDSPPSAVEAALCRSVHERADKLLFRSPDGGSSASLLGPLHGDSSVTPSSAEHAHGNATDNNMTPPNEEMKAIVDELPILRRFGSKLAPLDVGSGSAGNEAFTCSTDSSTSYDGTRGHYVSIFGPATDTDATSDGDEANQADPGTAGNVDATSNSEEFDSDSELYHSAISDDEEGPAVDYHGPSATLMTSSQLAEAVFEAEDNDTMTAIELAQSHRALYEGDLALAERLLREAAERRHIQRAYTAAEEADDADDADDAAVSPSPEG